MSKSKHAAVKRRRLRSFNRHVRWQKVNQTHSSAPPPCTHKHTLANTWKTAAVHFHTESKQPFCLEPPSGSETLCCHCSSVKRRRAELWLSAPCHCMCVQLHRGPGAWVSIPAAPAPPLLPLLIPQERVAPDRDSDLTLPSCSATSHVRANISHTYVRAHFSPSFSIFSLLTFFHNFPGSSFNQMPSLKQNFTVVFKKVILPR